MENQTQKKPVTAVRRGITGAIAGEVVMIVIFILVAASGAQVSFAYALIYLLFGPIYGFGFTFANWRLVAEKTKRGAVEGGAVLGIGIILSCLTENVKWGLWGWIYFVLRVSWHIGMCWIPGVWYGIQAIRLEKKELDQSGTARPEAARPPRPAAASAASPVRQPVPQPASQKASAPIQSLQPAAQKAVEVVRPALTGVTGIFAGTDFPVQADEELAIGSDPSVCQIVLPAECAAPIHCSLRYDSRRGCWQVRDLTDGQTFENGVRAIRTGVFEDIPKGRLICVGQGKYSQRFRLG